MHKKVGMWGLMGCAVFLLLVLGIKSVWYFSFQSPQDKVVATVFIHGTVGAPFNVINPYKSFTDKAYPSSSCARFISRFRNQEIMKCDQVLGDEGLHSVDYKKLPKMHAAHYIIGAYDDIARFSNPHRIYEYAIFGWSGFLSHTARLSDAEKLYDDLCKYRDQLHQKYNTWPVIHIVAHSHGGNVALLLEYWEQQKQRGLKVEVLCMYGTPMQHETKLHMQSPFFEKIVMAFSQGDKVQCIDYISTTHRKSYARMRDLGECAGHSKPDTYVRMDAQLFANGNTCGITHSNMWLARQAQSVVPVMGSLPFVVVTPLFIDRVFGNVPDECAWHLHQSDKQVAAFCTPHKNIEKNIMLTCTTFDQRQLYALLKKWSHLMKREWEEDFGSRRLIFNSKNFIALKNALWQ